MAAFTGNGCGVALPRSFTLRTAVIRPLRDCATTKRMLTLVIAPVIDYIICHDSILPNWIWDNFHNIYTNWLTIGCKLSAQAKVLQFN
jgi:hypothetical protein